MSRGATWRLSLGCNNACLFCAPAGLTAPDHDVVSLKVALESIRAKTDEVTFVGGEPTLSPLLPEAIATAKAMRFTRIGMQTNGRLLARGGYASSLRDAGLTDAELSLQGASAAVHDYHTGVAGSFAASLAGLGALRALRLPVSVTTVLTRSNFRVVGELPPLLASRGVAAWSISIPHAAGRAAEHFDRVVPRLGLALPFALHAIDAAGRLGLAAFVDGAPWCALGPFAKRALASEPRAYGEPCRACPSQSACPGVDATYLTRFGDSELSRVAAPTTTGERAPAARLFAGAGELSPPAEAPVSVAAKRTLPLLSKAQPAQKEVARDAAKRSGEALRELFPQLFEPKVPSSEP